jgi:hypothetical protein
VLLQHVRRALVTRRVSINRRWCGHLCESSEGKACGSGVPVGVALLRSDVDIAEQGREPRVGVSAVPAQPATTTAGHLRHWVSESFVEGGSGGAGT